MWNVFCFSKFGEVICEFYRGKLPLSKWHDVEVTCILFISLFNLVNSSYIHYSYRCLCKYSADLKMYIGVCCKRKYKKLGKRTTFCHVTPRIYSTIQWDCEWYDVSHIFVWFTNMWGSHTIQKYLNQSQPWTHSVIQLPLVSGVENSKGS